MGLPSMEHITLVLGMLIRKE